MVPEEAGDCELFGSLDLRHILLVDQDVGLDVTYLVFNGRFVLFDLADVFIHLDLLDLFIRLGD